MALLWTTDTTAASRMPACTPLVLASGGTLVFNASHTSTLTAKLTFHQPCDAASPTAANSAASGNATVISPGEPFYASTSPQIFAIATATVISYLLVIVIFITPRTFFVAGSGGAAATGFLGRSANTSVVGVGRRPWLQKIATLTVAISLTIATVDTFAVAKDQYDHGYTYAYGLVEEVVDRVEIKVVRVISDTFLWLAQVQTLIRLFPRHKEKVTIKWLGFALVSLDTIFTILNDFVNQSKRTRPRLYVDAIPALNYLFELAISLIYASCVIYYSLSKRRFAFWHARMRNICLVALLSLVSVLIPVVFFVLDVSKPDVAGWGDYIRWVGAAAASIVVWEWVERIEALERDERKHGILGREIFDGDEMLDGPPAEEHDFRNRRRRWSRNNTGPATDGSAGQGGTGLNMRALRSRIPFGHRIRSDVPRTTGEGNTESSGAIVASDPTRHLAIPPQAASPISRSDTTSAGSTIYAIRYHTVETPAAQNAEEQTGYIEQREIATASGTAVTSDPSSSETTASNAEKDIIPIATDDRTVIHTSGRSDARPSTVWRSVPNPFKRRRASPPAEVAAQIAESATRRSPAERTLAFRDRLIATRRKRTEKNRPRGAADIADLPITLIPAPRRNPQRDSSQDANQEESSFDTGENERHLSEQARQTTSPASQPPSASPALQENGDHEMAVLIIPAPRRGQRTWSPEDAYTGAVAAHSPVSSQRPDPDPPPDESSNRSPMISHRGTLTISERQARNPSGSSRRSTYLRNSPGSVSPGGPSIVGSTPPAMSTSSTLERVVEQESTTNLGSPSEVQQDSPEKTTGNGTESAT